MSELGIEALQVQQVTLDVTINKSEIVCLGGPSGSGKSLLLRAIADLIPHRGRVRLDDIWCDMLPAHQWRRQVGLLPAESQWWRDRVGEHFTDPEPSWFEQLGFSMDVLGWEVARCSTGEKQRLAILRLLCQRPKALLLDEPTASLDPDSISRAETLLQNYVRDAAAPAIWVTHDPQQQQRVARRRLVIRNDRVVEETL
ncbi:MAG: ABC transporter ATP-binding protein [Thiohalophilus sp.]|uniref:ABC transporter ATP-binding protein n=1 Tax=Thiohalophilus sp. TaxID=3028392 RepID=UPI0028701306|nr:ABC transporter ATP-binding protein [Thiohalophilus sp.]MDR9437001.1 ABC transporter ATP-binding protein [Thiohalophilus sp.]